jgi:CelD/BcsL family acetyltransferase involved in cellulose biosynthesis
VSDQTAFPLPAPSWDVAEATDAAGLAALTPAWRAATAGAARPTEEPEWARACAETLGADAQLRAIAVADGGSAAVAPLVWRPRDGRLELAGVRELYEPMDVPHSDPAALEELVGRVRATGRVLHLGRLPEDSAVIAAVRRAYGTRLVRIAPACATPVVRLDGGDPEQALSSRRRSDLRRARRRAEKLGPVGAEVLCPTARDVDVLLADAAAIEQRSWKGREGTALASDPGRYAFFLRYGRAAARRGTLRIAFLTIGDERVAMQLAIESGGRYWLLKVGFDEAFAAGSPGQLLMLETLRWAADRGVSTYELLGTAEPWTAAWTKETRPHVTLRAYPPSRRALPVLARDAALLAGERARPALRARATSAVARAARRYVAGPELSDALRVAATHPRAALGPWDAGDESPREVAKVYAAAADALGADRGLDAYLSIKAPAVRCDAGVVRDLLARGVRVHLDALAADTVDDVLALAEQLHDAGDLGVTLPGRWARSAGDAARVAALGLRVRAVKGQFGEAEVHPRAGYMAVVDALAEHGARHVAVATHDPQLLKAALGRLDAAGIAHEAELLHGLPMREPLRAVGGDARVYVPYGAAFLPYALDEVRRNPRRVAWLVRDALRG